MSIHLPQSALKRGHNSFIDKCPTTEEPTSLTVYAEENGHANLVAQATTVPNASIIVSTSSMPATMTTSSVSTNLTALAQQPPRKRTKLLDHDLKREQSAHQVREKAEEKARREQRKEEDRKKKEEERAKKRAALDIEKQAREEKRRKIEEEKKKREEEVLKKGRSQMKLGSFFVLPTLANKCRANSTEVQGRYISAHTMASHMETNTATAQAVTTPTRPLSPYSRFFPDFFIQNGVSLAPINYFMQDQNALKQAQENIERCLTGSHLQDKHPKLCDTLKLSARDTRPRGRRLISTKSIIEELYSGRLKQKNDSSSNVALEQLKCLTMKSLKFYEDVRPPYIGTYSRQPMSSSTKLARNPWRRDLPKTDYDFDSEAEWVEDEDGEDLKSDDEEEEIDDDDDIDGFLDDENDDTPSSRQLDLSGDLEVISTGLCWENDKMRNPDTELEKFRLHFILDPNMNSIDPFLTSYWAPSPTATSKALSKVITTSENRHSNSNIVNHLDSKLDGLPILAVPAGKAHNSQKSLMTISKNKVTQSNQTQIKLIAEEDMEEFKTAVVGSNLSKFGLIEVLKKRFPGRPAATIKATLEAIARRGLKGQKEADKRWVLI